ncbi:MAG: 5-formyltetrahydrofolate cyclo-ligase [Lachnospiraceae bacterium]|nr:5-formyltetrahydrofolate cyclo-ligase [Lachnospiraceae bacterium]
MDKKELRKEKRKARKALQGTARQLAQKAITERIQNLDVYKNAKTVLSFLAFDGEVELFELHRAMEAEGKQVAYPYCVGKTSMVALIPKDENSYGKDLYGLKVPLMEASQKVEPEDIDVILTPLVAFDENCHRLGMGAGIYDRFLPQCKKAVKIGVAFETQKVDRLVTEEFDVPLNGVITEKDLYTGK